VEENKAAANRILLAIQQKFNSQVTSTKVAVEEVEI
jgi:hypothetical protein